jgi:hypothetical protein
MLVHACNPSYSGGISKELGSKANQVKSLTQYLKNKLKGKGLEMWYGSSG